MRRPAIASLTLILLILLSILTCLTLVSPAQAYTPVSGSITQDTTWTKAGSPYNFTEIVNIASGVTLTIEPGVTVNLGAWPLLISGALKARGTEAEKIFFQKDSNETFSQTVLMMFGGSSPGWNEATGQGCIIENAVLDSVFLNIGSSVKLSKIESNTNFRVLSGSPLIADSHFYIEDGINVNNAAPIFTNNILIGNGERVGLQGSGNVTFSGNQISNFTIGIQAYSGNWLISNNAINNCDSGIVLDSNAKVTLQKNLITYNTQYGISGGNAVIESNTIVNNLIGIHNPSAGTVIHNNNIVGNTVNSITVAIDIDATLNWWGTTNLEAINQTIYDHYDDPQWGTVSFAPILNEPSTDAPVVSGLILDPTGNDLPTEPTTPVQLPSDYTPMPTVDHNVIKNNPNQDTSLLNLNTLVLAVVVPLAVVWAVVLLSYRVKGKIRELREA